MAKKAGWCNITGQRLKQKAPDSGIYQHTILKHVGLRSEIDPLKIFRCLFNDNILEHIVESTNLQIQILKKRKML